MSRGPKAWSPGVRLDRLVADLQGDVALDDPEALVLAVVHVTLHRGYG
jgi:hypothetical protein